MFLRNSRKPLALAAGVLALLGSVYAFQRPFREYPGIEYNDFPLPADWQTKSEWTFARLMYPPVNGRRGFGFRGSDSWSKGYSMWTQDYPRADRHFLRAVRRLTRIDSRSVEQPVNLDDDDDVYNWPWLYAVQVGWWDLTDAQAAKLRDYLLRGGFFMVDDFWGQKQWDNFEFQMKRVLPERSWTELPMDHPLFHCVFDIKVPKNQLQTPNSAQGARSLHPDSRDYGVTWEYYHDDYDNYDRNGEGAKNMHVRAIFDDKGKIMVIATHNCDNGDSWEREGEEDGFFHEFSEKRGYPLGINIIFYLMTH